MDTRKIRSAVGAIITQDNEVLLVHKVKLMDVVAETKTVAGNWDFPKGGVLPSDATLEQALMRELKEETGSTQYKIEKNLKKRLTLIFQKVINMMPKKQ